MFDSARKVVRTAGRFVRDTGHVASVRSGRPQDRHGAPVPWFTYPAIAHLDQIDWTGCSVLEWGTGNSTLWWASRAERVVTVDHDAQWHEEVAANAPDNVTAILASDPEAYVASAPDGPFDVVVIDGRFRELCAARALEVVAPTGMVVLDNSDRHPDLCDLLRARSTQIDFCGHGPINDYPWITSIFIGPSFRDTSRPGRPLPRATY